jgi:hypothetical protein
MTSWIVSRTLLRDALIDAVGAARAGVSLGNTTQETTAIAVALGALGHGIYEIHWASAGATPQISHLSAVFSTARYASVERTALQTLEASRPTR